MILHQGKLKDYIFEQINNYIVVVAPKGHFYLIPIGSGVPIRCSCQGYVHRSKCKHFEYAHQIDIKEDIGVIDITNIGPWTSILHEYALRYKDAIDKEIWYQENRVPPPNGTS